MTRPGGRVVLIDADWSSFSVDSRDVPTERAIQRAAAELVLADGYSGRQLYRLLIDQQLEELSVHVAPIWVTDYETARSLARFGARSIMPMRRVTYN